MLIELDELMAPLSHALQQQLRSDLQSCVRVLEKSSTCTEQPKSHFGGDIRRSLPSFTVATDCAPMDFIADISFSEVPATRNLPPHGRLLVFVEDQDLGPVLQTRCIWLQDEQSYSGLSLPAIRNEDRQFERVCVVFEPSISVQIRPKDAEVDSIRRIQERFGLDGTRLLGHWNSEDRAMLEKHCLNNDWCLLLQVDSFEPLSELIWWDNAKLQILIKHSDLKSHDFSNTVGVIVDIG